MSRSKSQLNSNLAEKTSSAASFPVELDNETPSTDSTRTQDSFKSPFFNFMRDFKQKHKNKDYQYVMRLGGRRWHAMTQADRAPYVIEAARNRHTAKPKTRVDKRQNSRAKEKKSDKKRCPACGHRKTSRERSRSHSGSSGSSQSDSSRSRSSKSSNRSKK